VTVLRTQSTDCDGGNGVHSGHRRGLRAFYGSSGRAAQRSHGKLEQCLVSALGFEAESGPRSGFAKRSALTN
jgi:hypothetical protein